MSTIWRIFHGLLFSSPSAKLPLKLLQASSTLPLECFYECEHLHNRALVSVLATGRNSTNFQAWPLFFCDRPNTQPILSLLKGWKGNRFLRSHLLMFVTTKNHWLAKLRWTENWFQQNEGVLLIMWWQMLECSKHDRRMMHAFWIHQNFLIFVLKSPWSMWLGQSD